MIGLLPTLLAAFVTFVITALCIAWSPFAALACARIAQRQGLSAKRPAVHGAIYSAILFLPWRHLIRQMRGYPITRASVNGAYTFVYVYAALALASHIAFIFTITYPSYSLTEFADIVDFIATSIAGALAFAAGLISLSRANKRLNEIQECREPSNAIDLPDISYIAPFAWAWVSMLISSATWVYGIISNILTSPTPWFIL